MFEGQTTAGRLAIGLVALTALGAARPAGTPQPLSPHAFQKLLERTRGAMVRVVSGGGGSAVIVGVNGELLVPVELVKDDKVSLQFAGERREGRLVRRSTELGLAMVALEPGSYPAATVGMAGRLAKGDVLLGLSFDRKGELATAIGRFERARRGKGGLTTVRTDVFCGSNSALFNSRGELVALRVARKRAIIPIEEIRARLSEPQEAK